MDNNRNESRGAGLDLYEQLSRACWLMHRYHQMNHRQRGPMGDPHRGQGRVLTLLSLRPEISQRDLLYLLDMRPQSLGELLSKLERSGYIERTPSEEDRRVMLVKLTEEGKSAAAQAERPDPDGLFDALTTEEKAHLSVALGKIIGALEAQTGPDDGGDCRFFGHGGHGERGRGPGGFPGFGPDGMRRDGGFRPLGGRERDWRGGPGGAAEV